MAECITEGYKGILKSMIDAKTSHEVLSVVVAGIPLCPSGLVPVRVTEAVREAQREGIRRMATRWPSATYYDEAGRITPWDSPSALYEKVIGGSPSKQVVCEVERGEEKCSPASMVQSFQIHGFLVRGNGEPPPAFKEDMTMRQKVELHEQWKQSLLQRDKKFIVYHPKAPQIAELTEK